MELKVDDKTLKQNYMIQKKAIHKLRLTLKANSGPWPVAFLLAIKKQQHKLTWLVLQWYCNQKSQEMCFLLSFIKIHPRKKREREKSLCVFFGRRIALFVCVFIRGVLLSNAESEALRSQLSVYSSSFNHVTLKTTCSLAD